MARRVPSDDGDSGAGNTDVAVRVQGIRVGFRRLLFNGDGISDVLRLLSAVTCS